jgi:glycosyltransferase involved in cell wall biosynthesis/O-antigen/teichoic acid export membrane protein
MSTVLETSPEVDASPETPVNSQTALRTDSIADSILVLLVLAAVQRIVGFARGVIVCRWLSPDELGQWDMAFGFLTLAAPLTVLGLPGSFGRYVEYFRQRGLLRTLVRRTAIVCTALTAMAVLAISFARPVVSEIVFGRPEELQLVLSLAISLAVVITFNYLTELLTAMRMARVTGIVQFFNSLMFAGFSVLFLVAWHQGAAALVAAYGLACALQIVWMLWYLRRKFRAMPADEAKARATERKAFWPKLLSFAAWVWVTNLLYNLFDVADRYMIIHTSNAPDPLAVVGSYHSSRIVPLLLVSVATLMGTMILPHLSHDWEAGRRREVSRNMNLTLKLMGLLLFVGSLVILLAAPLLFDVAFGGKFARGREALPWTLTYCTWFGLVGVAQLYLWCAERARLGCIALAVGLASNIVLNLILLPRFELLGAVWATAAANLIALMLIYRFNAWLGMQIERSMLAVTLLPLTLGFGVIPATVALVITIAAIIGTNRVLSADDKQRLSAVWSDYMTRFRAFHNRRSNAKGQDMDLSVAESAALERPLRVMFVTTSMYVGGAETLLFNLIRRMDRDRFSPELCCLKELGPLGEQLNDEIPVYERLLRNKFDVRVLGRLTKLLRERQIDAVITVGAGDKMFWGRLAARRAGVPVILSAIHSTGWPDGITWLNRRLHSLNDGFIAVAKPHEQYLIEHERLPREKVHIIPNGVDTERFRLRSGPARETLCRELNISPASPLVGIVAVLRPEKNHELFLQMAARVHREAPEAHFLIIGDGPRRTDLERLTAELNIQSFVHFLGQRTDVPELLCELDVFALTSRNEANPVSILEALAASKPVVATRVGSIPETVLEGKTGYLVDPGDESALSRRIAELLLDPAKARKFGAAGRQHIVEHWSVETMVDEYQGLIESLYREKRGCSLHSKIESDPTTADSST